jgi:uncharacterized surface protein with fasciclin (FAS1) repeats
VARKAEAAKKGEASNGVIHVVNRVLLPPTD